MYKIVKNLKFTFILLSIFLITPKIAISKDLHELQQLCLMEKIVEAARFSKVISAAQTIRSCECIANKQIQGLRPQSCPKPVSIDTWRMEKVFPGNWK